MNNESLILSVENLETSFFLSRGQVKAVNGISYEIHKGRTLGIVGESGCGKSVTSLSIMGLIDAPGKVTGGSVKFKGTNLLQLSEGQISEFRGNRMAMIFQEPMTALNPVFTIGEQIDEQILRHKVAKNKKQAADRSKELLDLVGIPSPAQRYHQYPHQLSGGMRQRAMIAMALSCEPELLIADEPTTALDVTIQAQILDLIQELQEKFSMGVQFITHDLGVISQVADDVAVMYAGQICEKSSSQKIFSSPLHPYTKALMKSRATLGSQARRLETIPGAVPALWDLPKGCAFQNRCPLATHQCSIDKPILKANTEGHLVACHHVE